MMLFGMWSIVKLVSSTTERFSIGSKEEGWLHETGHIIVLDKNKWLKSMQLQQPIDAETAKNAIPCGAQTACRRSL